jgi:hypothetical protein
VENTIKQGAILDVYRSQGKILKKEMKEVKEIEEKKVPERGEELKELILIFQDVISKAEHMVDGASRRKGLFHKVFKESQIEKSEEFAFLDPFAGEFEYRDGTIQFTGEIGVKDFTKGIVECLVETVSGLEKELPKDRILSLKLKAGIESSLEQNSEALKRLGVSSISSLIFK